MNWQHRIILILGVVATISFIVSMAENKGNIVLLLKTLVFSIIGCGYYIIAIKLLRFIRKEDEE